MQYEFKVFGVLVHYPCVLQIRKTHGTEGLQVLVKMHTSPTKMKKYVPFNLTDFTRHSFNKFNPDKISN
jgi:hypothetical protein